jgi:hypothetical protein
VLYTFSMDNQLRITVGSVSLACMRSLCLSVQLCMGGWVTLHGCLLVCCSMFYMCHPVLAL